MPRFPFAFGQLFPPPPARLTLSNFSLAQAHVEAYTAAAPDCGAGSLGSTVGEFTVPLNGTRVIVAPLGTDVCWRYELPTAADIKPGTPPLWSGWRRAYLSEGRPIDSTL